MTTNDKKNFTASLLEKAARGSAILSVLMVPLMYHVYHKTEIK